jgi:hypothetical protein
MSLRLSAQDRIIYTDLLQIRFPNSHSIPFTAQSGGHSSIASLGSIRNGIQIDMCKLNTLFISTDGTCATIGDGSKVKETHDKLWKSGKWTVHGMWECPGVTAVGLGGGHGRT